jgi:hypothetical protein
MAVTRRRGRDLRKLSAPGFQCRVLDLINLGPSLSVGSASFIVVVMTDSPSAEVLSVPSVLSVVDSGRPDESLSVDELGSRIVGLAGRLAAGTCRWLLLVAQFDAREGCAVFGLASTARWLGHYCGVAHRTAVEHVRVARALAGFPELAAAMGAGRLSYSQVRAISRPAGDGEHRLVEDLIDAAGHGTVGQLEVLVRGLRTVADVDGPDRRPPECVSHSWSSPGQWRMQARLDPERGAIVQSAIETIAGADGIDQAAALVRMAEIALAATAQPVRGLRGDERAAVSAPSRCSAVSERPRRRPPARPSWPSRTRPWPSQRP